MNWRKPLLPRSALLYDLPPGKKLLIVGVPCDREGVSSRPKWKREPFFEDSQGFHQNDGFEAVSAVKQSDRWAMHRSDPSGDHWPPPLCSINLDASGLVLRPDDRCLSSSPALPKIPYKCLPWHLPAGLSGVVAA